MNFIEKAQQFLSKVSITIEEKHKLYGSSAENPVRIFSKASVVEQLLVRIDDKLSRISRGSVLQIDDEDTLLDLIGYLALLAAARESAKTQLDLKL